MSELGLLALFPVLPAAKDWLREEGPGLEALVSDIAYNRARDRARRDVRAALTGEPMDERAPPSEVEAELTLLARPLARLIIAAVGEPFLASRYAVAESKRLSRALEHQSTGVLRAVAEALGVPFVVRETGSGARYGMRVTAYLMHAPNEAAWHLVKRDPERGIVWLDAKDFSRVLEETYRRRLEAELPERSGKVPAVVREVFAEDIERLRAAVKERVARMRQDDLTVVAPGLFPPCMKRILADMHAHVNVPHMGRFAIVSFLNHLQMDTDGILRFFSSVPDFDPEKSRYQIEHITGKGGPEAYTPPGCATMQSFGVCPLEERDHLCAKIKHPLSYYRRALYREEKRAEEREESAAVLVAKEPAKASTATSEGKP